MADAANNADNAGANGGADDNKSDKAGQQADDKAGKNAGANGGDQKDNKTDDSKKITFDSQEDLDKIIEKRLERERKKIADDANLSKEQKLEKERDEAKHEANLSNAKDAFIIKTGLPYEKALRVWNLVKSGVEFDGKGKPSNIDDLDKSMRKDYPELYPAKVKGKSDGGGGEGKSAGGSSMDDFLRGGR